MRPLSAVASFVVLASSLLAQTPQPPAQGHIVGTVVNDVGEPVAHAELCWTTDDQNGSSSSGCGNQVDDHGKFDIPVPFDTDRISAEKPDIGYWRDMDMKKSGHVVKLNQQQPTAYVLLKLGPKPAQVAFNVLARESGRPVKAFDVRVSVIEDQPVFRSIQIKDKNLISIPPEKDVMLIIQSPGYKRWFYKDAANAGQPTMRLQSGEEQSIDVELEPENAQN